MNTAAQTTTPSLKDKVNAFLKTVNFGGKDVNYDKQYIQIVVQLSEELTRASIRKANFDWIQNLNLYKQ